MNEYEILQTIDALYDALALAKSMIQSGEKMTEQSTTVINDALRKANTAKAMIQTEGIK